MTRTESTQFVSFPRRSVFTFAGRPADPAVVWLEGEYDLSTTGRLWETLARVMTQSDADLVIDLSGVEFMDAGTVGIIVRAGDHLRMRARSLTLRCPSPAARRVLDWCGLAGLVEPGPGEIRRMPTSGALDARVASSATGRVESAGGSRAAAELSAPDADLLAARHATNVARRRGP